MNEIVYLNGSLIPRSQADISAMDYGFLYGFGLFETMRVYRGRVFRLEHHLKRLARSAEILRLPMGRLDLKEAVMETVRANHLDNARIRITVSLGEGGMVPDPSTCTKPTVLVMAGDYQPYPREVYQNGVRATVSSIHRNSQSPLSRLKSTNYLESILARQEARAVGADETICLNEKGLLAEGSMSNIFVVTESTLRTPREDSGILLGITRQTILELASELGIDAVEHDIKLEELFLAEEAFLTNSLIEVMPLTEVEGKPIGSGKPGAITKRLMKAYQGLVEKGE
ncbi:MAG: branched-chain-amino-acid transaminase [Dehalococcoidia bacterium]|nr:MAG: branched-chain-amino-acid transaminase [Dehalococcoidia bacterium]